MIVTKDFVFIHLPKTGGTFVTEMLRKAYLGYQYEGDESNFGIKEKCLHLRHRLLRKLSLSPWVLHTNKHGHCNDIPPQYKRLPILGCIRNPFEWYVSCYEFPWWKKHPEEWPAYLLENPHFPDLSFREFLQSPLQAGESYVRAMREAIADELEDGYRLNLSNPSVAVDPTIGPFTTLFINFYFRKPNEVLPSVASLESKERIARAMYPVTFLHTETLNRDLSKYLSQFMSSKRVLRLVESQKPILPKGAHRRKTHWRDYYDADLLAEIRERDRLVFSLFPAYNAER